jgi:hypothetical protein
MKSIKEFFFTKRIFFLENLDQQNEIVKSLKKSQHFSIVLDRITS